MDLIAARRLESVGHRPADIEEDDRTRGGDHVGESGGDVLALLGLQLADVT